MSTRKKIPAYRPHKPSGQARVILDGRHVYLGPYGSSESHEKYARLIAESFGGTASEPRTNRPGRAEPMTVGSIPDLTVGEVMLRYLRFARTYYVRDGRPTKELACMQEALRPLRRLYGRTPAREFGPRKLKALRDHMVEVQELARTETNKRIGRVKRFFKWAVSEELVPPDVHHGLATVRGLAYGRSTARETEPVRPVAEADVMAILPFVSPQVAAMIQLQWFTGMRPGEVVQLRPCDVDRSGDVWVYEPPEHKNRWRGHTRQVPLGPRAQQVLTHFLDRDPESPCFAPAEAEEWRNEQRALQRSPDRKTPVFPSELAVRERRRAAAKRRQRKRPFRDRFDTASYRRAIDYGIRKARRNGVDVADWSPNRIRHSCATAIREAHGIEAAQVVLGHARAEVTQVYAERNLALARRIAAERG